MNTSASDSAKSTAAFNAAATEYIWVWQDPPDMVARNQKATFPARCVVCGDEQWMEPLPYKIMLDSGPLGAFVPNFFMPYVTLNLPLCRTHRRQELIGRWGGHGILLVACGFFIAFILIFALGLDSFAALIMLAPGFLFCMIWAAYCSGRRRFFRAKRIKGSYARIPGVHSSVLRELPPLPPKP